MGVTHFQLTMTSKCKGDQNTPSLKNIMLVGI
jgi:hypothetical protein